MALKLLYGRAGTGKTAYCLNEIRQKLSASPEGASLILLLPEHETFKTEKLLASTPGLGGFTRSYVFGFRRFAHRVLLETGGALRPQITELGKRLLLTKVLHASQQEWKSFHKAARQRNFAETLASMIEEFKSYGIDSAHLKDVVAALDDSPLKDKLEDLSFVYQGFTAGMEGHYTDAEDCLNLLAERLPNAKMVQNAEVWIDGFRFFNPQESAIICSLLKMANTVTITLCIDDVLNPDHKIETSLFHRQWQTRCKLLELAETLAIPVQEEECKINYRLKDVPSLFHIEQNFYRFPIRTIAENEAVHIVEAANRRLEVEGVAADMIRLCREEGHAWKDIAVLVRDQESYEDILSVVFTDYDIPFFSDRKRRSVHHPLSELLRSALEAIHGFQYEALFRCFKTDFFPVKREQIDLLENYVLEFGIRGNRWTMTEDWTYSKRLSLEEDQDLDERAANQLAQINEIRQMVIAPLRKLEKQMHAAQTVTELTTALYDFLLELAVPNQLEAWAFAAEKNGNLDEAREHQQLWDHVVILFEQMVETSGEETMTLETYEALLGDGLEGLTLSLIPPGLDYVTIAPLDQNSVANCKAAYIVGANEGVLPKRIRSEGLLTDAERLQMVNIGLELSPGASADNFAERFLIYSALTRASQYLWVSYPLADSEGNGLGISSLVSRLREMLSFKSIQSIPLELNPDMARSVIAQPRQALSQLLQAFRQYRQKRQISPIWQDVYNWAVAHEQIHPLLKTILSGLFHQGNVKPLPAELAGKLYTTNKRLRGSVTRFEQFRACPFQHFAQYGLMLKERAEFRFAAPDLGQLLHAALKNFGDRMQAENRSWGSVADEEYKAICGEIVDHLAPKLQNEILLSSNQHKHLLGRIKRTVEKSIKRLIEFDRVSAFSPIGLEKSFGRGKDALPPLSYALEDGYRLEITGQIDRVDSICHEGKRYFLVIDYKSGQAYINLIDVYYGLKLQLLTYLLVVQNSAKEILGEKALPAGVLYYFLKNPNLTAAAKMSEAKVMTEINKKLKMPGWILADEEMVKKIDSSFHFIKVSLTSKGTINATTKNSVKTEEEFFALLHHMDEVLVDTGKQILAGDVAVSPYQLETKQACSYCKYHSFCQFDRLLPAYTYRNLLKIDHETIMQTLLKEVE
ncbi:helicase-exonuclease AddAB subunit AddB [Anaerosinus massiliensis]|uniref:helicase-exonuclease AddAB subunit AddB n=1 Tax=Massilibacillus massiliensis TaxID=1806837 RepID=UPI000ABE9F9A|nr:helicase-exonuclease AddAB subunit AddB [Massilibacillus massiliensis]